MQINLPLRTVAYVFLDQIQKNLKFLIGRVEPYYTQCRGAVAMVKADAYGHGLVEVGKALAQERSLVALGVATMAEGVQLRNAGVRCAIWIFSDCSPWTQDVMHLCERYSLSPVFFSQTDVSRFLADLKRGRCRSLSFQLKWNTGMNRLGMPIATACRVAKWLTLAKHHGYLKNKFGLCTHFANAGQGESSFTKNQFKKFVGILSDFSSLDTSYIHCAGTAAILREKHLKLGRYCNVIRPGIGLYGYTGMGIGQNGKLSAQAHQLKPALVWKARVVSTRMLKQGDVVGYGTTYQVKKTSEPESLLGIGYGDGWLRCLSNQKILVGSTKHKLNLTQVLGRVSMDLTSIRRKYKPGQFVSLLGESPAQGEFLAHSAGTIVYELLTNISSRVPRLYR